MLDGHPAVNGDAHDGVDAAIHAHKIHALQEGAEQVVTGRPSVVGCMHLEREQEKQEKVHQSQIGHVDGGLSPLAEQDTKDDQGQDIEDHAKHEDWHVYDKFQ